MRPPLPLAFAALALAVPGAGQAQTVALTTSNLPIVLVQTNGQTIPDEPKIAATMQIVYGGPGVRNSVAGPFTHYDGPIGIERRGATSQTLSPKDPYAVETRDSLGADRDVTLFGFPKESDWVLLAPYADKSLLRDALAYEIAHRMGRYASRFQPIELVVNGDYRGVYWLMEKVKRDPARVVMANLKATDLVAPAITGGYLAKFDKKSGADTVRFALPTRASTGYTVYAQYHHPKRADLLPAQRAYFEDYLGRFDRMMASPTALAEYGAWIDRGSWVDYLLAQEVSKNVDGYRLSAYFYKMRDTDGGRLVMGPVWDFNLAFGGGDYYQAWTTTGFQYDFAVANDPFPMPPWWAVVRRDPAFRDAVGARWAELRQSRLRTDSLLAWIDATAATLDEAQRRNYQRWPVINKKLDLAHFVGGSYANEVAYLKTWLAQRLAWLDQNLPASPVAAEPGERPGAGLTVAMASALPARTAARWTVTTASAAPLRVGLFDALGREVRRLHDGPASPGALSLDADVSGLAAGLYVLRAEQAGRAVSRPLPVVR